jgi:hypothetical protein
MENPNVPELRSRGVFFFNTTLETLDDAMKTLLGLPFRRKELSDAKYIERLQQDFHRGRRTGIWFMAHALAIMTSLIVGIVLFAQVALWIADANVNAALNRKPNVNLEAATELIVGILLGVFAGHIMKKGREMLRQADSLLKGDRTVAILLKYHDAIVEIMESENRSDAQQGGEGQGGAVKTFLGLPLRRKRLSDAEYIERLRKDFHRGRRLGKWFKAFAVVAMPLFVIGAIVVLWIVCQFGARANAEIPMIGGFFAGVLLAFLLGRLVSYSIETLGRAFNMLHWYRDASLLLKYRAAIVAMIEAEKA